MTLEQLIDALNQAQPYLYSREGLAAFLNVDSLEDRIQFLQLVQQGIDQALIFESKKHKLATREHLGFIVGTFRYKSERYGFVECEDEQSFYCAHSDDNGAFDQDIVLIRPNMVDTSCEVVKVLDHQIKTVVGEVLVNQRKGRVYYRTVLFSYPFFVNVPLEQLATIKEDSFVLLDIVSYGESMECNIQSVIAPMSAPFADIDSALIEKGILLEYPQDAVSLAAKSGSRLIIRTENRKDLRHLLTMTIDGDDAKDFDDALSFEETDDEYIVYVSIADVATYVEENTCLDLEAYRRGTSIYVPGKVIPMLPFELSNGACSLNPNVDRYAITAQLHYQKDGTYIRSEVYPSIIQSKQRMTYRNVNRIFNGELLVIRQFEALVPSLIKLLELSQMIQEKRKAEGGVSFVSSELNITMDKKGNVENITKREDGLGENLIETFMIEANIAVAKLMSDNEFPCVYRIHEAPDERRMDDFKALASAIQLPLNLSSHPTSLQLQTYLDSIKDNEFYDVINGRLLRSMSKARYDQECLGHYGLGLEYYCHFTSPIRRYPDLLVHRYLWKYYFTNGSDSRNDKARLMEKAAHCSDAEATAVDVERDITAMKVCQYMQHKVGQTYQARITSITGNGIYVTTNQGIDIFCPFYLCWDECVTSAPFVQVKLLISNYVATIGDSVSVRVTSVNELERKVIGECNYGASAGKKPKPVASKAKSSEHKRGKRSNDSSKKAMKTGGRNRKANKRDISKKENREGKHDRRRK